MRHGESPEALPPEAVERLRQEHAEKLAQQIAGYVVAAMLVPGGMTIGSRAGDSKTTLVFAFVMVLLGLVAAFPKVFMPLAQDLIRKFMKDTPADNGGGS